MRNLNKILFVSLLSLFVIGTAHAQITKSPAAEADKAFNTFQYVEAAQLYKKAYSKVKRNPVEKRRIMFQMAECYTLTHNLKMAEKQYLKLEKVNYQKDNPLIFLRLGDINRLRKDFPKALEYYKKYKQYNPDDPRCDDRIESATLAPEWINNPTRDEVENMKRFNTPQNEWVPAWGLPKKENQIVFTSSREGGAGGKKTDAWTGEGFSDLYVSNKPKSKLTEFPGEWTSPVMLDNSGIINSDANEGEATFNGKGTTIYFSRCPNE
ncbi:MAG: tetratricopeptide repeat protein, partial [Bacteroidales bacterium]|nr:tetratricopeptide repeat protein [Bacteroidales bacterium]